MISLCHSGYVYELCTFQLVQAGGDPLVLCFVDFVSPAHAATAMDALQGEMCMLLTFPNPNRKIKGKIVLYCY